LLHGSAVGIARNRQGANMVDKWLVETDLSEEFDFYTRANIGEVFPDPVAPFSFSYFQN
jgi:hypothetical protein